MKNQAVLWIVFVVVVVAVIAGVVRVAKQQGTPETGKTYPITVLADDHAEGAATLPVTIVEYSDFQCPACAAYFPVLQQLRREHASTTRIVYRHFPLQQHKNAKSAAYAAEAASMQGNFFPMHDELFAKQAEWSELADPSERFLAYAQTIGLDLNKFKTDWASQTVKDRVERDIASGKEYDVNATPTFYVNGKKIKNPSSIQEFKSVLDVAALRY